MKNLALLLFCLTATLTFGQTTKFNNDHFTLVQDIFHKTTEKSLNAFMVKNGFTADGHDKDEDGSMHTFRSDYSRVEVYYSSEGEILGISDLYVGSDNNIFIEGKIKDAGYSFNEETIDFGDFELTGKRWTKAGSKLTFLTVVDDELGGGTLTYGILAED